MRKGFMFSMDAFSAIVAVLVVFSLITLSFNSMEDKVFEQKVKQAGDKAWVGLYTAGAGIPFDASHDNYYCAKVFSYNGNVVSNKFCVD